MGLSWGFGYFYTQSLFEKRNEDTSKLLSMFIGVFVSAWIGAKVFFLWFSSGQKIYQYLYANYFWLGGGFVFYGGLVFGLIFYLIWSMLFKKFESKKSHLLLPGLIWGHSIGRIGCFLTGCCYGRPSVSWWAIKMHEEYRHPVQLYEALALFIIGIVVQKLINLSFKSDKVVIFYLASYATVRFVIEFFRGDEIRGSSIAWLSSSQFVSLGILLIITIYYFMSRQRSQ